MIPVEHLALISCHLCNKAFNDQDEVCTIAAKKFVIYNMKFEDLGVHDSANDVQIPREINFHFECFKIVAGNKYTP